MIKLAKYIIVCNPNIFILKFTKYFYYIINIYILILQHYEYLYYFIIITITYQT